MGFSIAYYVVSFNKFLVDPQLESAWFQPLNLKCDILVSSLWFVKCNWRRYAREPKLGNAAQQEVTRWAVYQSASMLKQHEGSFLALVDAMESGASVADCLRAIEAAEAPK